MTIQIASMAEKISTRTALVGVVGLGYVGLPLALAMCQAGYSVVGFDLDPGKIDAIGTGQSYIKHIPSAAIAEHVGSGRLSATRDFAALGTLDVVVICVPTPLNKNREPDLSYVVNTARTIAENGRVGQLVILESTTYPGTTTGILKPIFEEQGFTSGYDVFLAFSPEREDPGNPDFGTTTIPKVVGGDGPAAQKLATLFYSQFVKQVVPVSSPSTAEAVKITENIFRAVNIALVNELKVVFQSMDVDIWEVIDAAKTKPFGFMPFYPGPGLGGHCIPIDPFYLTWKAREYDLSTRFIELAGEINTAMPRWVVEQVAKELDERFARGLNGAKVLILGLAYKKNVDDMRESPSLKLIQLLRKRGAEVSYSDPYIPVVPMNREHPEYAGMESVELTPENLAGFDCVLISTDHDSVDYEVVVRNAKLVVDTRNACARRGISGEVIAKA